MPIGRLIPIQYCYEEPGMRANKGTIQPVGVYRFLKLAFTEFINDNVVTMSAGLAFYAALAAE